MCNSGQLLLSSLGLSRDGMGCCMPVVLVLAGREEGAWGHTRGSLLSHPRGCRAAGPPPRAAVTLSVVLAPLIPSGISLACDGQFGIAFTWREGALSSPKRAAPEAVRSSWLLGAPRPLSKGHVNLDNQHTQLMWGWGKVSSGHWGGHDGDAGGWDGGMQLPPCSFQHTTRNLTCSRACS